MTVLAKINQSIHCFYFPIQFLVYSYHLITNTIYFYQQFVAIAWKMIKELIKNKEIDERIIL